MPVFAELADGRRLEFPDGTDPAVIQATVKRMVAPPRQSAAEQIASDPITMGAQDPTQGMSQFERVMAGAGKALSDTGLGVRQLFGMASPQEVADTRRRDAPLMQTGAGMAGNIGGQIAQMAIPGAAVARAMPAAPFASAALQGGAFAGAQPVAQDESRLTNTVVGAGLGAAGEGIARGAGLLASRARDTVAPEVRALYERAQQLGIPVNMAQLGDSKFLKTLQSVLERMPMTGAQGARNRQQEAFNTAVSRTMGENTPKVTREVYAQAKGRIGGEFDRLTSTNNLPMTPDVATRLSDVTMDATRFGTNDTANAVANAVDEVMSKVDPSGLLPGRAYQALDSKFGKLMKGGGEKAMYLGQVREVMREAMDQGISAADKEAWQTARTQYRNLKTVRDLVAKEGADGNISPSLLMGRVNASQAGKESNAMGRGGDIAELARIGRQFVRDPVPDSGTAQRAGILALLGGGLGLDYSKDQGLSFDPTLPLLAAGGAMTLGRGANALINSRLGNQYLLGGGSAGLLSQAARLAPTALPASGLLYLGQ